MAGAHALGEFVSLDAARASRSSTGRSSSTSSSQAPPPGELQGKVALVTGGAGGIGRAIVDTLAAAGACVVGVRPRRRGRRGGGRGATATAALGGRRRRHQRGRRRGGVRRRGRRASAASTSSSPTPASPRARAIEETTLAEWNRNHAILGTGYFLVAREAFRVLQRAGHRRLDRLRRLQERARGRQERRRLLVGQGGRAAPRALPGRGGRRRRHPRQHRQPRRRPAGLADLGLVAGARSAPPPTASSPTSSRSTTASAPRWGSTSTRGHRRGGAALRLRARARARAPATCSTSTAACRRPTRAA